MREIACNFISCLHITTVYKYYTFTVKGVNIYPIDEKNKLIVISE